MNKRHIRILHVQDLLHKRAPRNVLEAAAHEHTRENNASESPQTAKKESAASKEATDLSKRLREQIRATRATMIKMQAHSSATISAGNAATNPQSSAEHEGSTKIH